MASCRVGLGYDIHRLESGKKLVLGGVVIESDIGLVGHSDADALLHSITDAILGACGEPDIGEIFSPSDEKWRNTSSDVFVKEALNRASSKGLEIQNVDTVIIAERPKLKPWKENIRKRVSEILEINADCVGIKAKTSEGLGPVGEGKAIEARAVVLLRQMTTVSA
jgi:2-C-methyl-D-erythritol 2,4-cyclodiphosphate synthase